MLYWLYKDNQYNKKMGLLNLTHNEPLFGLDIGHSNIKAMQIEVSPGKNPKVLGYGFADYPPKSMANGVIVNYTDLSHALYKLFTEKLVGSISSRKVACTIPTSRTFSRAIKLPSMDSTHVTEAVRLEAEQYIPVPLDNLYIDYEITSQDDNGLEVLMVATPKNIVDSYVKLLQAIGLQPVALEPTMSASSRLFALADPSHGAPSLLIDFGSISVDMAAIDKTMFVNSTVAGGSDTINDLIAKKLGVSPKDAYGLKNTYGISSGVKQQQILEAVLPLLENLIREAKKIIRYYDERAAPAHRKIAQIITIGGGANTPGLNQYLSKELSLPTRMLDPWHSIDFAELKPPSEMDRSMYITVAGEAILATKEIYS